MTKRTSVVIGVGAEIGRGAALCRRFASEGLHVLIAGRTPGKLEPVVRTENWVVPCHPANPATPGAST